MNDSRFDTIPQDAIAIVGMAGRFPGAANVREFWRNLREGRESVTFFSRDVLLENGVPEALLDDPLYVRAHARLDGVEFFDADFFGIPPREAEIMDPQHRLFLECAEEALENAGYDPEDYAGRIGVFGGTGLSTYLLHHLIRRQDLVRSAGHLQLLLCNNKDYLPLRVSYKLNLKGPSVNVNTACSSSLVAVHLACQNLLDHQCDMALAGGMGIQVPQDQGYLYSPNGIGSPDGHCRAFDRDAQGTVSGNGGGAVLLKRLEDALSDGDCIHALILASAINNDGAAKVGFTAPSVEGQAKVIAEALALADVPADSIGYVETHGTATPLGDRIEMAALTQAFRSDTGATGFCAVGSVKTNIGHLDEGAGIAGLIKTVLALRQGEIPPSLHFLSPNPEIDFARSPFHVQTALAPWEPRGGLRRAGVSSFGLGGTNAHAVLQEAPPAEPGSPSRPWQLLLLSARTADALDEASADLAAHLRVQPEIELADVAYTLQAGRKAHPFRRFVCCRDAREAADALQMPSTARAASDEPREVAFLFPGQGSQYPNMGRELYESEPGFREPLDRCCDLLIPHLGFDLRGILYAPEDLSDAAAERLQQTAFAQPALFALEYALARLWIGFGIVPARMLGHSLGEYVAACLAGVFSLEDALALVAARGRLMQQMAPGAMLAVERPEAELRAYLGEELELAACNAPSLCVVSGAAPRVEALGRALTEQGIPCQPLHTSHAFHSKAMEPMLAPFLDVLSGIRLNAPQIPYVSNLTGDWITAAQATDPDYWRRHLRHTVRFCDGAARLLEHPETLLLEVGPGYTLGGLIKRHPAAAEATVVQSLPHPREKRGDVQTLMEAAGRLWTAGACRKFKNFFAHETRRRVELPTYPFQRKRYWIEPVREETSAERAGPGLPELDDWFYAPRWKRREKNPVAAPTPPGREWLLFVDHGKPSQDLLKGLRAAGLRVTAVTAGEGFRQCGADRYVLDPGEPEDYLALFAALAARGRLPQAMVHAWNLAGPANERDWEGAQTAGFYSLVCLARAAGREIAGEVNLFVLSSHLQRVVGDVPNRPLQATSLGAVRVIPKEYPQIRCRSIDLALPEDEGVWLDRVITELLGGHGEPMVALRGEAAWTLDYQPLALPAANSRPPVLRQGGTYLLTGGYGSMGLAFARYLAGEVRARLVLLGRSGLPPESDWDLWLTEGEGGAPPRRSVLSAFDLAAEGASVQACETEAKAGLSVRPIDGEPRLQQLLNAFCSQRILGYLEECGVPLRAGTYLPYPDLRSRLKIVPRFEKFLDFLLRSLAEDGVIALKPDGIEVLDRREPVEHDGARRALLEEYGEFEGLVRFLEHCTSQYRPALSGEIPSISVLYPDGTPALMDECGRGNPRYSGDQVYLTALARLVSDLVGRCGGQSVKILEIGGGAGGLTLHLVQALRGLPVEYHFTDLGGSLVRRAQRRAEAEGIDFMRFASLDISRDPVAQGFEPQAFDLVVGYNVVHAAPDIARALGHLHRLLAPGGLLALVETTRLRRFDEMVWGLTEGWWHFTDQDLRDASPLMVLDDWERVLKAQGFAVSAGYPQESAERRAADTGLILAQKSQDSYAPERVCQAIRTISECRRLGAEVLCLRADVADGEQLSAALQQARERFGPVHGVVHAAGVLGQGVIHGKTAAELRQVLAPKVAGTLNLGKALKEQETEADFLLLCSSLAAVAPDFGQVDYCAANAFLDAYAAAGLGNTRVIAVDWGFWQDLGMIGQAHLPEEWKRRIAEDIRGKGLSEAGVEAFKRILAHCQVPQVLVAPGGLQPVLQGAFTTAPESAPSMPPAHPWFAEQMPLGDGIIAYIARLSPRLHWVLDEHRPLGQAVLPGTAYLELAYAAAQAGRPGRPVELGEVYFLAPLVAEDQECREIRILLAPRGAGFEFSVISRAGQDLWTEHARGDMAYLEGPAPDGPDLDSLRSQCGAEIVDGDDPFMLRVSGFTPRWRCLRRVDQGQGQALAWLALSPELAGEVADLPLHPGLLDMATGYMAILDGFESGAPFAYRRVRIWRPLTARLYSHVTHGETLSGGERAYDIRLLDEEGHLLLEAQGYRLREYKALADATEPEAAGNFCVEIDQPGSLGTLALRPARRRAPGPGQVEIEVAAAGLNFIEVLYALGLLPEPPGPERVRFGLECAGTVSAVGEGVTGLSVGDPVYGLVQPCFSRYAIADAGVLAKKPDWLEPVQAAALPAAYATAYYALITRGRLRRGEKVLIHAAAGGVGLAAVHVAAWRGAEIYATAGSPEKRAYLEKLGVRAAWDSRSLEFAQQTLAATQGRGVAMVLNSLGGEFIPAGLSVLARYGRFLELGKRDILADAKLALAPFEKHLAFMAIDVGADLPEFESLWRPVTHLIKKQVLPPLPCREFPLARVQEAFEFMAQARHTGKVVLRVGGVDQAVVRARPRGQPLEAILKRWRSAVVAEPVPQTLKSQDSGHARPDLATPYRAAGTAEERTILELWEELLGVSGIGVDDDFFQLRGDSLLAAQVTSRLYQAFQVKLPLSSVFEYPTVAGLADRIAQLRRSARELGMAPAASLAEGEVEHEL